MLVYTEKECLRFVIPLVHHVCSYHQSFNNQSWMGAVSPALNVSLFIGKLAGRVLQVVPDGISSSSYLRLRFNAAVMVSNRVSRYLIPVLRSLLVQYIM